MPIFCFLPPSCSQIASTPSTSVCGCSRIRSRCAPRSVDSASAMSLKTT